MVKTCATKKTNHKQQFPSAFWSLILAASLLKLSKVLQDHLFSHGETDQVIKRPLNKSLEIFSLNLWTTSGTRREPLAPCRDANYRKIRSKKKKPIPFKRKCVILDLEFWSQPSSRLCLTHRRGGTLLKPTEINTSKRAILLPEGLFCLCLLVVHRVPCLWWVRNEQCTVCHTSLCHVSL